MAATGITDGPAPGTVTGTNRRSIERWFRFLPSKNAHMAFSHRLPLLAVLAVLAGLHVMTALLFLTSSADGEQADWDRLPIDEAWSRMTYVRSFSESFTLEFNDGDAETGATSPLWVAVTGTATALFGVSSDGIPAVAKTLGIVFGIVTVWMTYRVTWQITRKRRFGLLAGAVLAVEPHFGFAAVSGMEVTLFAAVSLGASWAYLRGRVRTSGVLAALAITARPEGLLLALLIVGATLARWTWRREGALFEQAQDVRDIAFLGLPSLLVVVSWVVYNWAVAGSALPASYLAANQDLGLAPLSNLWNVWLGYLHELPFMDGLAWVVGLPLILLGIYSLIVRHSFSAAPIALFAAAMIYAAMVTFSRPDTAWEFADRRHMDAALPFLVIMLAVGTSRAWQLIWRWHRARKPRSERERKSILITARVAAAALLIAPLAALPVKWNSLTSDYAWNSRNIEEVSVSMGLWLGENTPEDTVIGAVPAGAIRFHSGRRVLDLSGANTHKALRSTALDYGLEQDVDYLVAFREPFFDSIPGRAVAHEELVSINTILDSNIMRAYGPPGTAADTTMPRDQLAVFDPTGLRIIDTLDVGNSSAAREQSEAEHDYGLEGHRTATTVTMRISGDAILADDARVFGEAEEFTTASVPGQPLTIVKRYDATIGGRLRVVVDGVYAGEWELSRERVFFGEASFTVPARLLTASRTRLRFEVIPGQPAIAGNSFFYWILVPEGSSPPGS